MYRGYRIRLYPTRGQEEQLWKTVNAVRWTWNWGLNYQMERYKEHGKILSAYDLRKQFTIERNKPENGKLREVAKNACSLVLFDLDEAYKRFKETQKEGVKFAKGKIAKAARQNKPLTTYDLKGHPKFKSAGKAKPSLPMPADGTYFQDGKVFLVKVGHVKFKTDFDIPEGRNRHKFYDVRVCFENGKWMLSFAMEQEVQKPELNQYFAGVDLGIKTLATVSCNDKQTSIPNINKTKEVRRLEKRLRREQRKMARREKPSNNRAKIHKQVRKTYAKLRNIRHNHAHQSTRLIANMLPLAIGIEDLNVSGMMKNRHLAKAIQNCGFAEFRTQLEYKAESLGIEVVVAGRFFPSSKLCSSCGHKKKKLGLKDRTYICAECGLEIDRDFNAALNLERLAGQKVGLTAKQEAEQNAMQAA